ncbi:putative receptor-like protein 16 isoform X1 [Nicotiana sylvestris]|uniref:putative receptor-like protein 16 isoform X1 n=1 Tax=Nicotiana sylvestris TaxID=4096 RepID=UPI00388C470F
MSKLNTFSTTLKKLDIRYNSFQSFMPNEELGILRNIKYLLLDGNTLDKNFLQSSGVMPSLKVLSVANCGLTGTLPIQDNKLSGELPIELARNGLFFLRLSNNMLEGEIFQGSTNINNLQYLYLDGNNFSGSIPQKLSSAPLSSLDLSNNSLSGNLPSWIGYIPSLTSLALSRNHLKGPIPADYCRLEKLEVLDLSRNNLVGVIPSCFSASQNLKRVYLSKNNLRGQFDVFSNSSNLKVLDLKDNNFTGSIPKWLGSIEITTLLLKGNYFQGTIPTELCYASELRIMDLSHNNLLGPIPHCFGNIMQIEGISEAYPYGPIFSYPRLQTWGRDTMIYVEDSME